MSLHPHRYGNFRKQTPKVKRKRDGMSPEFLALVGVDPETGNANAGSAA
jgi:hypothetical protein